MAVDTPATLAIVGGGPIGLEAALYGRYLGYTVVVYERLAVPEADEVPAWEFAAQLVSPLGMGAVQAQDESWRPPEPDERWTRAEWSDRYLKPLAESDLLADSIRYGSKVTAMARSDWRKHENPRPEESEDGRGGWDFLLQIDDAAGSRIEAVDAVIDASGLARKLGNAAGGLFAPGERDALHHGAGRTATLGSKAIELHESAGRKTLVIGDGHDALATLETLLAVKAEIPSTEILWATPHDRDRLPDGPLPMSTGLLPRDQATAAIHAAACSGKSIAWLPGASVARIERIAPASSGKGGWKVQLAGELFADGRSEHIVDVLHLHGLRIPDWSISSELQLAPCAVCDSLPAFSCRQATRIGGATGQPIAAEHLALPEPNFFVIGEKSFGRRSDFRFADGLAQIRSAFALLADRAELDLYAKLTRKK